MNTIVTRCLPLYALNFAWFFSFSSQILDWMVRFVEQLSKLHPLSIL
ncbi:MAG: hypothetical protein JNL70_16465 [Saprospiraceae bacterium]|nr:hypothetical protein [Saprospiraceae bacterium]